MTPLHWSPASQLRGGTRSLQRASSGAADNEGSICENGEKQYRKFILSNAGRRTRRDTSSLPLFVGTSTLSVQKLRREGL